MPRDISKDENIKGKHLPIMLNEVLSMLDLKSGDIVLDCTLNRAGHAKEFVKKIGKNGVFIGNDLDAMAIQESKIILDNSLKEDENSKPLCIFINDNFKNIKENIAKLKSADVINKDLLINKVFIDMGLSSQEIDISGRGFSFSKNEPLFMTFKDVKDLKEEDVTAKYIVNNWSEDLISDIIYNFSDEKYAKRIAKNICLERGKLQKENKEIETTFDLVNIIYNSAPSFYRNSKTHFATKTFQAIRMAVNDEIGSVIKLIEDMPDILSDNAKIIFLTFHSTEDRIVKRYMQNDDRFCKVNKKVITPSRQEIVSNPRSRSCKLRCYEFVNNKNK